MLEYAEKLTRGLAAMVPAMSHRVRAAGFDVPAILAIAEVAADDDVLPCQRHRHYASDLQARGLHFLSMPPTSQPRGASSSHTGSPSRTDLDDGHDEDRRWLGYA